MKKLLVLSLVLGIASLATATLTLSGPATVNVGESISITLSQDDTAASAGTKYLFISDTTLVDASAGATLSPLTEFGNVHVDNGGMEVISFTWTPTSSGGNTGGSYMFDLTGIAMGDVNISIHNADGSAVEGAGALDVSVVPEPATMALLGLGALVLRRKK